MRESSLSTPGRRRSQEFFRSLLKRSEQALREHRRDKPDGQPGSITTFDPNRVSFKESLIALVFSGLYLEALLHIVGCQLLGHEEYERIDRTTYEVKLKRLGIMDEQVIKGAERYRTSRNDIVHEKAYDSRYAEKLQIAQDEARHAIALIHKVRELISVTNP